HMLEAVTRYRGSVSHVLGDGVVAIFGAPNESEDHAVMACLAARAILDTMETHHRGAIRVRVGVHSGEVVFRHVQVGRSHSYDSIGAAVHIAARLEQTAEPGTACISAATRDLARGFINADALNPVAMKGFDDPLERFLLVGVNPAADRWSVRSAQGLSRFTGREQELSRLRAARERCRKATARLVHIVGPPGIGKSRLLYEFLQESATSCRVVRLAGGPLTRDAAFQPVRSWMLEWMGIRPADSAAAALDKLDVALRGLGGFSDSDRQCLSSLVGLRDHAPPGAGPGTSPVPLQVEQALARMLDAVGGEHLLVLACDDADSFDPMTRELLRGVARELATRPCLVVMTGRTRQVIARLPAQSLKLEPLSDEDAGKLLAERDARFSTDQGLTQAVIRKTGGNPLFLEEVAALAGRTRAQPGELMPDEGGLDRLTLVIPERIESLIADRLAELPNRQRRLLELCAVIGDEVQLDLLRPLADGGGEDIERRLERLLSKHLVYATDRDSTRYSFRHSIIRDVCINGMLIATRRSLHVRILELLERTVESRHDARIVDLCYHAINAERWDRAVVHLREAADAATESFAFKAAVFYLKRALDVTTKLPPGEASDRTRLDLLLSLRGLLGATDEFAEVNRLLDEAEAIAMRLGDPDYQARILAARIPVLSILGDLGGAAEAGRRSRLMALKSGDRSLLAAANFFLGQTHFSRGELARAEEALSENARLLQAGTIEWRPAAMGTLTVFNPAILAAVHALQGRVDAAERAASAALEAARLTGRPYDLGLAHLYDGFRLLHRRSTDAANAAFARAFEHAQERGLGQLLPPILIGLGQALLQTGDVPTAIGRLNEGRELSGTRGRSMMLIWASAALALASLRQARTDEALALAQQAVDQAERHGFAAFHVQALRALGLAQAHVDRDKARATLGWALTLSNDIGTRAETAHCHVAISMVRHEDAVAELDAARRIYREIGIEEFLDRLLAMPVADWVCQV
ncbi:MAG: AAA family ATPase, partial [Reyranellaceae bacterium]